MILSKQEKAARAKYQRDYRKKNPLQIAESNKRYWTRKVKELRAKEALEKERKY